MKKINIAIDGFSSCGKSTLAKALAKRLRYKYIDTGAMYRAIGLYAFENGWIDSEGEPNMELLEAALHVIEVEFHVNEQTHRSEVFLNDRPVEQEIRNIQIASLASKVSKHRSVRNKLQLTQRAIAKRKGVIMDGRDIGTVVMPDAELKIFMTADPSIRAERRFKELSAQGKTVTLAEVAENQSKRDYEDTHRAEDPLRKADEAIILDNTDLSEEEQLDFVYRLVMERVHQEALKPQNL